MSDVELTLDVLPVFPAAVFNRLGFKIEEEGGAYYLSLDYTDLQNVPSVPVEEQPDTRYLVWNATTGEFRVIPYNAGMPSDVLHQSDNFADVLDTDLALHNLGLTPQGIAIGKTSAGTGGLFTTSENGLAPKTTAIDTAAPRLLVDDITWSTPEKVRLAAGLAASGGIFTTTKNGLAPNTTSIDADHPRLLVDDATWSTSKKVRLAATPVAGRVCNLGDYGIVTGQTPGVDNAAIINGIYALATHGDTFVLPTTGDTDVYGQLTFFDSQPNRVPDNCTLRGATSHPSASGVVRRYAVSDFRQPFMDMSPSGVTIEDMTIYIHDGFSSGAAVGIIQAVDEFVIHPRVRNVSTTQFGDGGAGLVWAIGLCLDGSATDGGVSRGIRDAHVNSCNFWSYSYCGMYFNSMLASEISGVVLTPQFGAPALADISMGGNGDGSYPSYSNTIVGPQLGAAMLFGAADNNTVIGPCGVPTFNSALSTNNVVVCPTYNGPPAFNFGLNNICILGQHTFYGPGASYHVGPYYGQPPVMPSYATVDFPAAPAGAIAFDSTSGVLKYSTGSVWVAI